MRCDCGVDANEFTAGVYQCASTIAWVDSRIGLNKGFYRNNLFIVALGEQVDVAGFGRNDTRGNGWRQVKGIANGQNPLANFEFVWVANWNSGEVAAFNFEYGNVGRGVGANNFSVVFGVVVENNLNFAGVFNDVVIGDDITLRRYNDAGASACTVLLEFSTTGTWAVEKFLEGIPLEGGLNYFSCDMYHRMNGAFCCCSEV